ncbi:hypothetical protein D1614_05440 [Maribellus luteus]|uniref:Uncharacterized protein n=1 Tax=Maribellus luteus TaxID=2305463 RepID=A0A399T2Y6_9BACT|nr:hypothetical protein D1614_05440 [Maribellus luteus]
MEKIAKKEPLFQVKNGSFFLKVNLKKYPILNFECKISNKMQEIGYWEFYIGYSALKIKNKSRIGAYILTFVSVGDSRQS